MDPNATFELLIEAAIEGDADVLLESAADLAAWIEGGGFPPGPKAAYTAARRAGYNPLGGE